MLLPAPPGSPGGSRPGGSDRPGHRHIAGGAVREEGDSGPEEVLLTGTEDTSSGGASPSRLLRGVRYDSTGRPGSGTTRIFGISRTRRTGGLMPRGSGADGASASQLRFPSKRVMVRPGAARSQSCPHAHARGSTRRRSRTSPPPQPRALGGAIPATAPGGGSPVPMLPGPPGGRGPDETPRTVLARPATGV
jgi:hypothetical protein